MNKRGKGKNVSDFSTEDMIKFYNTYSKEIKIDLVNYRRVIDLFTKKLIKSIIEEGSYIKLPYNLGDIFVGAYNQTVNFNDDGTINHKKSNIKIDYKATNELWKIDEEAKINKRVIYHENDHTNGKCVKIYWKRNKLKNIYGYMFEPSRAFKRALAKFTKLNPKLEYYDL